MNETVEPELMEFETALSCKAFEKAIAAMNRRARRMGVPEITYQYHGSEKRKQTYTAVVKIETDFHSENFERDVTVNKYSVSGVKIENTGYTVVGKIVSLDGEVWVEDFTKDKSLDREAWSKCDPTRCDHCNTKRARKSTFIVVKDGQQMQVGSDCFEEIVGKKNLFGIEFEQHLYSFFNENSYCSDIRGRGAMGSFDGCDPRECIAQALFVLSSAGWRSAERDYGHVVVKGTHHLVKDYVCGNLRPADDYEKQAGMALANFELLDPQTKAAWKEKAEWVISRVCGDHAEEFEDFAYATSKRWIPTAKAAMAAALVPIWRSVTAKRTQLPAKRFEGGCGFSAKDKVELDLTCVFSTSYESDWGTVYITKFQDDEGHVFVLKGSNSNIADAGGRYKVKATIKGFGNYLGEPQVSITRGKVFPSDTAVTRTSGLFRVESALGAQNIVEVGGCCDASHVQGIDIPKLQTAKHIDASFASGVSMPSLTTADEICLSGSTGIQLPKLEKVDVLYFEGAKDLVIPDEIAKQHNVPDSVRLKTSYAEDALVTLQGESESMKQSIKTS